MKFNTIVVAVDGSTHGMKALELAADLAVAVDAVLHVVSVYRHHSVYESTHSLVRGREAIPHPDSSMKALAREICQDHARRAKELGVPEPLIAVRRGAPARGIVDYVEEVKADCVVVGSQGLGDSGGLFLGSVSQKVATQARCTCITVK